MSVCMFWGGWVGGWGFGDVDPGKLEIKSIEYLWGVRLDDITTIAKTKHLSQTCDVCA